MNKLFLTFLALFCLATFSANAVVIQKASGALALRNTLSTAGYVPKTEVIKQSSLYRVHLISSDSGATAMSVGDEVEISLPVTANHSWKASYPSNITIVNDVTESSIRKLTFKLNTKTSSENTIDFDLYNTSTNAITKSKYATLRIK